MSEVEHSKRCRIWVDSIDFADGRYIRSQRPCANSCGEGYPTTFDLCATHEKQFRYDAYKEALSALVDHAHSVAEEERQAVKQVRGPKVTPREEAVCYAIYNPLTGLVKIGATTNLNQRLADLSRQNGCALELLAHTPGGYSVERDIHKRITPFRQKGEWFQLTPEVRDEIARFSHREAS